MSKTFTQNPLHRGWKRRICLLLPLSLICAVSYAQTLNVTGKITDGEGTSPLPGASIVVKGTSVGTTTDANGEYSIAVEDENTTLVFSFIGYASQEIAVGGRTRIDISLTPDVQSLEEIVVVGYGTQRRKDLTGAVAHVDVEELQAEATSNLTSMLRGNVPGLAVNYNTSAKGIGSASDFLVRGETSVRRDEDNNGDLEEQRESNQPLVVVDGMLYYGDLSDINPADVQTIDILKDASSTAIYGSRASNGVILITTKKGKRGKPTINISTNTGLAYISHRHFDLMNGEQFIARRIAGYEANERRQLTIGDGYYKHYDQLPDGVTLDVWKAYDGSGAATDLDAIWLNRIGFAPIEVANYKAGRETDFSKYTWQTGVTQDYNVSVGGASEAVSYYMSLGYTDNEGIRYNEGFSTIRARLNLEADITDWLAVGTNTQVAFRDESPIYVDPSFYNTPYSSMYEEDGETLLFAPSGYINAPNFWLEMTHRDRMRKYNSLSSKLYGRLTLPFGISFTSEFIPRINWNRVYEHWSSDHDLWALQGGRASRENWHISEWQVNNILKWNKTFGDHAFDVTLLQNAEKYQSWYDQMYRQRFLPSDVLGYHRMQAAAEDLELESDDQVSTADALMARVNYTLKNKYNFTASVRRDGYSAFGQFNPRATFWSVAGGWTISEEAFFGAEWIDNLKLRLSYGTNGNRGVDRYDAFATLATGKFVMITNGAPGYVSQLYTSRMANPRLKWETTEAYNAGVDFSVFDGALRGNIELYHMISEDMLVSRQLPNTTGFLSVFDNLGQIQNRGIEFGLSSRNVNRNGFTWTTDFSFAFNRNKIVTLYGDQKVDPVTGESKEVDDPLNKWFIGRAVDEIWDYKTVGIWQESEAELADEYSRDPGDYKLEDVDNNKIYTDADKQFLGYRRPPVMMTMRNVFTFRNWELMVKMYANVGHKKSNPYLRNNEAFYDRSTYYNVPYWTPENPGNKWARIDSYETGFDVWEDNSFLRIDNVALTYNFPSTLLDKLKVQGCSLSIMAGNPFVWAPGWSWMDPENNAYTPSYTSLKFNLTL
jgi:TonB-dependent starch-binding outer membrane protein SusC